MMTTETPMFTLTEAYCMYMGSFTRYPINSDNLPQSISSIKDLEDSKDSIYNALTKATGGFPPKVLKFIHQEPIDIVLPDGKTISIKEKLVISACGITVSYALSS
jgi:hypothetical protein